MLFGDVFTGLDLLVGVFGLIDLSLFSVRLLFCTIVLFCCLCWFLFGVILFSGSCYVYLFGCFAGGVFYSWIELR